MPGRRDVLRLAELLASAPTVSYREHEVLARIRRELDRSGIPYASDRWGNLLARYRSHRPRGRPVAFTAHTDHPGLIVTSCRGRRAEARWLGGVAAPYFRRAAVRIETAEGPVRGQVTRAFLGPNRRVAKIRLTLKREVPVDSIGGWDLTPFRREGPWIRTKSADDLLGCAAVLSLMRDLAIQRPPLEVWAVFTRAEEDGLLGATAVAEEGTLPSETAIVVLETSKELPCGLRGKGPVVRVGDRKSVYDPGVCRALHDAAEELAGRLRSFRYQRGLMDGGVCEATAFQSFGYRAGGLALPLGNYHNMGERKITEEIVHEDDLWNLSRLLPVAARRLAAMREAAGGYRETLTRRIRSMRRLLIATREPGFPPAPRRRSRAASLATGLLLMLFGAETAIAATEGDAEPILTKPAVGAREASLRRPAPPLRREDPRDGYDVEHYDLSIRIDPDRERISGEVTVGLKAVEYLSEVVLDLWETLAADSISCNGEDCSSTRRTPGQIEILLPTPLEINETAAITLKYDGTPGPAFFSGFEFFSEHGPEDASFPVVSTLSQPDRAHGWWPCKDVMADKATFEITVEAPVGFLVASNGNRMREETEGETTRTSWATSYPIATYLVSIAATDYAFWADTYHAADGDSIPLLFYAYPEDEAKARIDYEVTSEALEVFETRFGRYPFRNRSIGWEKLGVAEFPWGTAAMEHQTCISYGEGFITGTRSGDYVLAHEIAHQWWGDAVTLISMDDIWLNEGFATYAEALLAEAREGTTGYRKWMKRLWKSEESEFVGTIVRPTDTFGGATVYRKGAWVLHMLRGVLGDDLFFEGLRDYYENHEYGNASTIDFVRSIEESILEDLRWFFYPWLYGTGRPHLAWEWWSSETGGDHEIRLYVDQTQTDPLYPEGAPTSHPPAAFSFPLEVRIFGAGDSLSRTLFVDRRRMTARIGSLPFAPDSIALDPDEWILRAISPRGEKLPAREILVYPNPAAGPVTVQIQAIPGRIGLAVYDITGRKVRSLPWIEGPGIHQVVWDGADGEGHAVAAGLYIVRAEGAGRARSARVAIVR